MNFGLAPLKPEGTISMIVDNEIIEDGQKYAINNAKDKLVQYCAKAKLAPYFEEHDLVYGTQIIAYKRAKR